MNRICLDTSAYSHFKRGHAEAVSIVGRAREVGIPAVVLGEVRTGFRLGSRADRNEEELRAFLVHPAVRVLDVDDDAASIYADLVADLRRKGTPLPTNDVWIAAVAVREGAIVLTHDAHFQQMRRVGAHVLSG